MNIEAFDMVQGAFYIYHGLKLVGVRTVWVRGQLVLGMEFEGEDAQLAEAQWNGPEVPLVMVHDYRSLILALAKLVESVK